MEMSSLVEKIHNLEEDIAQLKTSQALGSSSSRIIPVADIDITEESHWHMGLSLIIKFTSSDTINPIIMPRLSGYVDGVEQTDIGNEYITYDEFENALLIALWTETAYELPNEKNSTAYMQSTDTHDKGQYGTSIFRLVGTIYASCLGKCEIYTHYKSTL